MKNNNTKASEANHEIIDENNILANASFIPNIVDEMDLSVYAFRLYVRFKRRVNQQRDGSTKGSAYDSTKNLALSCRMSPAQVTRSKKELVEAGLIRVQKVPGRHGEFGRDVVYILDIWKANKIFFSDEVTLTLPNGEVFKGSEARRLLRENQDQPIRKRISDFIKSGTGNSK